MVKICENASYREENNEKYKEHFETFPFPLSDFQKHAIESVVEGQHSLICCPTGSGKTLPAEFAIDYFVSRGKRVIYTSPLKALSNEKYYDFTKKYPHIEFGVLTGDSKVNPDAQVLIMTAEILLNTLFSKLKPTTPESTISANSALSFEMNFETELGCVIMDEIHFINDSSRGHVWEQTLMILPYHIQLIMLSATLDSPEKFAQWVEDRDQAKQKEVYLSISSKRIVPLTHYSFITTTEGFFKQIKKDEALTKQVRDTIERPLLLQSAKGEFSEKNYHIVKKTLQLFENKNMFIKRKHVINQVCKYMVENNLLPAVLFILSRKQIETVSKEITTVLLEDDSKVPYIIHRECENILRKLPNYEEYLQLPEYVQMVALLQKGIGIHHSGVIPILREITEILFSKGYIKLLLATETFSVGLNMPIKTTVFTSLSKFDGIENRYFYSHEYMQCSGRAGRRGIDDAGTVIHLNNLFMKPIELTDYKLIMNGKPQLLVSKFKLSYGLLFNLINMGEPADKTATIDSCFEFIKQSMMKTNIENQLNGVQLQIVAVEKTIGKQEEVLSCLKTPLQVIDEFIDLQKQRDGSVNKKRKEYERKIQYLIDEHKTIHIDTVQYKVYKERTRELDKLKSEFDTIARFLHRNIDTMSNFLEEEGFLESINVDNDNVYKLSRRGQIAAQLKEVNCIYFSKFIVENRLQMLPTRQLVELFSCFTNIVVQDDLKTLSYSSGDEVFMGLLNDIQEENKKFDRFETDTNIHTGMEYSIHYDLINVIGQWYDASNIEECKMVLQSIEKETGIFLGEFVKAILKINTIASEMEKIAENIGNMALLSKLKEIPIHTLKYVATNQSLYI